MTRTLKSSRLFDPISMAALFASKFPSACPIAIRIYVDFVYDHMVPDSYTGYVEKHHCVPVSLDDDYDDDSFNLFKLPYADHIAAHFLLWKACAGHDDGMSKKGLQAVCMTNQHRVEGHPTSFTRYLLDVANGRFKEVSWDIAYGLINVDTTDYIDETGLLMANEDELRGIVSGDADAIELVRRRVMDRNVHLEMERIRGDERKNLIAPMDFTSIYEDIVLIEDDYVREQEDVCLPYRYKPYPFQAEIIDEFFDMLEGESTKKRFALELHRRAGKDVTFFQLVTAAACMCVGDYAYMLPTHTQAKKVIWNGTVNDENGDPCKFSDFIPPMMNPTPKVSDNRIELANGSNIYVIGSDNYDSLVGMNLKGVVFSEWSLCNPLSYDYLAPMLRRNAKLDPISGWALFCWTPRGKNHAYKTRQIATMEKNKHLWYFMSNTIADTTDCNGNPLISEQDIQEELDSGADPDKIKQEYYLDYDAAVKGIIYGKQMEVARREGRIRMVDVDTKQPLLTFWDIGVADETAIWFVQQVDGNLHLVNYYENTGEGLDHYVKYMQDFSAKTGAKYGKVYFPHDGKNQEFISGTRRHVAMMDKGFDVFVIPRTTAVETAIYQTKELFPKFIFDEGRCFQGINCLDNYRRKVNMEGTEGAPHHDWASNGSDALRQIGQYFSEDPAYAKQLEAHQTLFDEELEHSYGEYNDYYEEYDA